MGINIKWRGGRVGSNWFENRFLGWSRFGWDKFSRLKKSGVAGFAEIRIRLSRFR